MELKISKQMDFMRVSLFREWRAFYDLTAKLNINAVVRKVTLHACVDTCA